MARHGMSLPLLLLWAPVSIKRANRVAVKFKCRTLEIRSRRTQDLKAILARDAADDVAIASSVHIYVYIDGFIYLLLLNAAAVVISL